MKAIILAAGRGSRMKTMTDNNPKCLVELNGEPLLQHQLRSLRTAGITEIGIVTGYRAEMLQGKADKEFHNPRWRETNMVSSLAMACDWLAADTCIISYSDIFYEPAAIQSLIDTDAELAITYDPGWERLWTSRFGDPLLDAETFRVAKNGCLIEIGAKPQNLSEVEGQYMGLLRTTPAGWMELSDMRSSLSDKLQDELDMTSALQRIIDRGNISVKAVEFVGRWGEVDSASDLEIYQG